MGAKLEHIFSQDGWGRLNTETDTPVVAASKRTQDIIAGLSIAGLLLPEAVAYSSIAALPPQAGVIALFAGRGVLRPVRHQPFRDRLGDFVVGSGVGGGNGQPGGG